MQVCIRILINTVFNDLSRGVRVVCYNVSIIRVDGLKTADENQIDRKHHEHCIPIAHRFGITRIESRVILIFNGFITVLSRRKDRNETATERRFSRQRVSIPYLSHTCFHFHFDNLCR